MQTNPTRTFGLLLALGAVSCGGGSVPAADPYAGFVDSTGFDAKFAPSSTGYQPQMVSAGGNRIGVFNFGSVTASSFKLKASDLAKAVKPVYTFPEGCVSGMVTPPSPGLFADDQQYALYDTLPTTSSALPVAAETHWLGTGDTGCNAIKNHETLTEEGGPFGGAAEQLAEGAVPKLVFQPIIDMSARVGTSVQVTKTTNGVTTVIEEVKNIKPFSRKPGWFRGLQLETVDGGELPVLANGNIKTMDAVLVHPAWTNTSAPQPTSRITDNRVLILQAAPGSPDWSPVVRVKEYFIPKAAAGTTQMTPDQFKSLCTDACDPSKGQLDVVPLSSASVTTILFLAGNP